MVKEQKRKRKSQQIIDIETARAARRRKRNAQAERGPVGTGGKLTARRKFKQLRHKRLYIAAFIVVAAVICVYAFRIISLKTAWAAAAADEAAALAEKSRMERELEMINEPEYVEQQARTRLRMIRPGEILYVLPDAAAASPAAISDDPDAKE
jgi:cell division protein FtsB